MRTRDGEGPGAARAGARERGWRGALGWALLGAVAGAAAAPLDPNLLEEGIVVHAAERMLGGEHLYRDIVLHTAPLPYELLTLLFQVFGARLEVARAAVVVLQAAGIGLLYAGLRRAGLGVLAHPATAAVAVAPLLLVPLFSTFFYTTLAFYLALIVFYAALRSGRSSAWAAATGALVGCIALSKQSTGVILAAALLPGLLANAAPGARLRRLAAYAGGGAAMAAATLALYALRGDLAALLFAQIELPLAMFSDESFRTPYVNLWPPGELAPAIQENWVMYLPSLYHMRYGLYAVIGRGAIALTQLLYLLPLAALAATLVRSLPCFRPAPPALWLHGAVLLSMAANLHPRADWGHLVVALPPALVQLLLLAAGTDALRPTRPLLALAGLLLAALLGTGTYTGWWLYSIAGEPSFGPRVPLLPISRAYRTAAVPRVIEYLRRRVRPGEAIFVPRQEPLLYFATGTRNPTPFPGILPAARELQEPAILAGLEPVRFVVMSDIDQPIYTYYGDELPRVQAYLERHFEIPPDFPIDDWSWISVARRVRDRGATAVDLIAERPRARAWVRDGEGRAGEPAAVPQRLAARLLHRPLPIALGALGGGLDFELVIPPNAEFQAGVGYRGLVSVDYQYIHPSGTTMSVSVARAGAPFEELASQRIDDRPAAGRRWTPLRADLSDYAGERVTLRLEVKASQPIRGDRLAWWGSPRIAVHPRGPGPGRSRATRLGGPGPGTARATPLRSPTPRCARAALASLACGSLRAASPLAARAAF